MPVKNVEDFASKSLTRANCPLDTLMWPISDQEPTIDALIVTEEVEDNKSTRVVKFIQITIAESHRADLAVLREHMRALEAQRAEFYFVLPCHPRSRISKFRTSPIINKNAMADYGWSGDAEQIRSKMEIVTFPGWEV